MLIIASTITIFIVIVLGVFLSTLQQPYTIQINTIDPKDMTSEEWLEDFEYLFNLVKENYPFLEIKTRTHGYNWLDLKNSFEGQIKETKDNNDFLEVIMGMVDALQNRHTYVLPPQRVIQHKYEYMNKTPYNELFTDEVATAASYWESIFNQYYSLKFNRRYDVTMVYEKGEYQIYDYNSTWNQLFGNKTKVTHVNGQPIDEAVGTVFDRDFIDYDFKRNKRYLWSIYPRHFGEDAIFRIQNSTGQVVDVTFGVENQLAGTPYKYPASLVNCTIYDDKRIGYLYVGTFVEGMLAQYIDEVQSFYQQLSNVDNLIIDIRGNTGGFYYVWIENIVQPLIKETIRHEQFFAYTKGAHVNYLHQKYVTIMDRVAKDSFSYLPPEVMTDDYNLFLNYMTYKPSPFMDINVDFNGNITLLIDNVVFSAAEGFANFCNLYDFATIYGTTSGGDGIMLWPQFFVLPNSKIVINSASAIGLDITGYAIEEFRTQPDHYYESSFGDFDELINHVIQQL